ncbi:MAG: DUF6520 family protein [Flavobacteriaceae bacterium]|nr:DUF6520 family protein [Flavobacteriaceae bacterium]
MKTKAIKTVIPTLAILFAIGASAFGTGEKLERTQNDLIRGYEDDPEDPCNATFVDCSTEGDNICTLNGNVVYQELNGTTCSNELRRD